MVVEREISAAVTIYILRERGENQSVVEAFGAVWDALGFERRINAALVVAGHLMEEEEVKSFRGDLTELRLMRNAMAHNPFWHEPQIDGDGRVCELVPMVMRGKHPLPLTTPLVEGMNALVPDLIERSRGLKEAARLVAYSHDTD